jgi:type II secretion system protein N
MPRRIFFESQGFKLDELFKFLFTWQASLPETNPIVVDLLRDLSVVGSMNAQLDLDLDHTNVTASEGKLILNLIEAAIRLGNVELAIKDQILQKAFISATMKRGELTFDENSGLSSEGLDILVNGKIKLNPNIFSSLFEMLIDLKIKDDIRENYGFILDAVTQRISNGEIRIQIRGSLGSPEVKTI